jgi:malate dehydrogenase (oxaloacetate-decarboxylating)
MVDSKGIIGPVRSDLNQEKKKLLSLNTLNRDGSLEDAVSGSDIFIGVSKAGLLTETMIKTMQKKPIIFALANPEPEILPDQAKAAGAFIVATGRSDFPNQVNNALGFPGIFRGALDNNIKRITDQHKIAAAEALASLVENPSIDKIVPSPFDPGVVDAVANAIR